MEIEGVLYFFLWLLVIIGVIGVIAGIASSASTRAKRRQIAAQMEAQFAANMQFLQQRGLVIERTDPAGGARNADLFFDFTHKLGAYQQWDSTSVKPIVVFPLDKIVECTLIQDGSVVHSNAVSGTIVSTSIMGVGIATGTGSAPTQSTEVGALSVRILLDDLTLPSVVIHLLVSSVAKSSDMYLRQFRRAQEIYGIFEGIVRINEAERAGSKDKASAQAATKHQATQTSDEHSQATVDLLRELGDLRDSGVITAKEFESKKKALLDQIGQGPQ